MRSVGYADAFSIPYFSGGNNMIKIVHIADVHLDSTFAGLSAREREERRAELRRAFSRVCAICREESVDLLLIAGDLFENDYVSGDTPSFVAAELSAIPDTRVFISPGNHDPYGARSPYRSASFSDNVHIFTEPKISAVDIPSLNTTVYGYGFDSAFLRGSPLERFSVNDKSRINILCAHGDLGNPDSQYGGISEESLTRSFLDYAALGHIHTPGGFKKYGKTVCAYSGCLVGRGFDECGMRGAVVGEIKLGGASLKYRVVGDRRYESVEISVSDARSDEELVREIKGLCSDFGEKTSVKIVLSGMVSRKISVTEGWLARELPPLCELVLSDETIFVPDISGMLSEQSLRGEFCRRASARLESEDEHERQKAALALKLGLDALHGLI